MTEPLHKSEDAGLEADSDKDTEEDIVDEEIPMHVSCDSEEMFHGLKGGAERREWEARGAGGMAVHTSIANVPYRGEGQNRERRQRDVQVLRLTSPGLVLRKGRVMRVQKRKRIVGEGEEECSECRLERYCRGGWRQERSDEKRVARKRRTTRWREEVGRRGGEEETAPGARRNNAGGNLSEPPSPPVVRVRPRA